MYKFSFSKKLQNNEIPDAWPFKNMSIRIEINVLRMLCK